MIYVIDGIIFISITGWVVSAIRSDIRWYDQRQREKQSAVNEKR